MNEGIVSLSIASRNPVACLMLLGIMTLGGCSSSNDDSAPANDSPVAPDGAQPLPDDGVDATPPATAGVTSLTGTWQYCTGASLQTTYVFEGDRFEQYLASFSNADCSGEPDQDEGGPSPTEPFVSGVFTLGATVTSDSGVEARELDFSVRNVLGNAATAPLDTFTIVSFISPTELVFPFGRGNAPESRPLTLDFDAVYRRID